MELFIAAEVGWKPPPQKSARGFFGEPANLEHPIDGDFARYPRELGVPLRRQSEHISRSGQTLLGDGEAHPESGYSQPPPGTIGAAGEGGAGSGSGDVPEEASALNIAIRVFRRLYLEIGFVRRPAKMAAVIRRCTAVRPNTGTKAMARLVMALIRRVLVWALRVKNPGIE